MHTLLQSFRILSFGLINVLEKLRKNIMYNFKEFLLPNFAIDLY